VRAILLDLDDTVVPDYSEFLFAVDDTAAALGAPAGMGVAVHAHARALWRDAPQAVYPRSVGLSSWEALWAPFSGPDARERELRAWSAGFRAAAWRAALADHDVADDHLAQVLATAYPVHRLARCRPYADAVPALQNLRPHLRVAMVTNGIDDHQRTKLETAGLCNYVDVFVSSSAVGVCKPDARIFAAALERVGCAPADAVMVGDNPIRDVAGAQAAGIRAVWIDRDGGDDQGVKPDARITDLAGLAALGWW
jgi:2-haloalkanoic acid dehalogenase type II